MSHPAVTTRAVFFPSNFQYFLETNEIVPKGKVAVAKNPDKPLTKKNTRFVDISELIKGCGNKSP